MECRRRRILDECGFRAAEWQFKFSFLLSGVLPKVLDVAHDPNTKDFLYVDDAQTAKPGKRLTL